MTIPRRLPLHMLHSHPHPTKMASCITLIHTRPRWPPLHMLHSHPHPTKMASIAHASQSSTPYQDGLHCTCFTIIHTRPRWPHDSHSSTPYEDGLMLHTHLHPTKMAPCFTLIYTPPRWPHASQSSTPHQDGLHYACITLIHTLPRWPPLHRLHTHAHPIKIAPTTHASHSPTTCLRRWPHASHSSTPYQDGLHCTGFKLVF